MRSPLKLLFATAVLGLVACGGTQVPAWAPDPAPADLGEPLEVESVAQRLKADPDLRAEPVTSKDAASVPPTEAWLVRIPAADASEGGEVLYSRLVDLGVAKAQIELLQSAETPTTPRFGGDGEPGFILLRIRRVPAP